MIKESMFMSGITILLICNIIFGFMNPDVNMSYIVFNLGVGAITSFIILISIAVIIAGLKISVLGTSLELDSESISITFGVGLILALLFQVNIAIIPFGNFLGLTLPIGMGLGQNLIQFFPITEGAGLGFFLVSSLILLTFISGLLIVKGSGE
jgi:hypothetical protein